MWDIENHKKFFPNSFVEQGDDGRVYGTFIIGNYYKRTVPYHGAYPPSYLNRIRTLFPDNKKILHLFSGMLVKELGETTFDINPTLGPDVYGNAEELSRYFEPDSYDLIISDPPYDQKNAAVYGTKVPRTHLVMSELSKVVSGRGYVVWLCTRIPMYRKDQWDLAGLIMLYCGTNRLVRAVVILQRKESV